jgi:hypothetical protein
MCLETSETGARLSRRVPVPRRNQETEEERVAPRSTPSALGIVALLLGLGDRQACWGLNASSACRTVRRLLLRCSPSHPVTTGIDTAG